MKVGIREPVLWTGHLEIVRDFTGIRDVIKVYLLLLKNGSVSEVYNVCSGVGRTLKECLDMLLQISGVECKIENAFEMIRPVDNPVIVGSNVKIKSEVGWNQEVNFESGLANLYDYWLKNIYGKGSCD